MIEQLLEIEEGYREKPYYCSMGYPTIGIGTKIGTKGAPLEQYCFSVSKRVAYAMLNDELASIRSKLVSYRWYTELNTDRQVVIKSMAYQLGIPGLFKFKNMIKALEVKDYDLASIEALDSLWSKQTPARAQRHARVLCAGKIHSVEEYAGIDS